MHASKLLYTYKILLYIILNYRKIDFVYIGHINIFPLGYFIEKIFKKPIWLQIHGIDAWEKKFHHMISVSDTLYVTSVSRYTRDRFMKWAKIDPWKIRVLPNTFPDSFKTKNKPLDFMAKHELIGRQNLITIARLDQTEGYKGHRQILSLINSLKNHFPNILYNIIGDGLDIDNLKNIVRNFSIEPYVKFWGYVDFEMKKNQGVTEDTMTLSQGEEGEVLIAGG